MTGFVQMGHRFLALPDISSRNRPDCIIIMPLLFSYLFEEHCFCVMSKFTHLKMLSKSPVMAHKLLTLCNIGECPLFMSWTEILYLFIVLLIIIYVIYFIMRRAPMRDCVLDHCATRTAQRFSGQWALFKKRPKAEDLQLYRNTWQVCTGCSESGWAYVVVSRA